MEKEKTSAMWQFITFDISNAIRIWGIKKTTFWLVIIFLYDKIYKTHMNVIKLHWKKKQSE